MKRLKWLCCTLLLWSTGAMQQVKAQPEVLQLQYNCETPQIAFANVYLIDRRQDRVLLGQVQKGAFNRQVPLIADGSFTDSLMRYFRQEKARIHANRDLVILLDRFLLSEQTGAMSEHGYVKMTMRFFSSEKDKNSYAELPALDTVFVCGGVDVTRKMLRNTSEYCCYAANRLEAANVNADATAYNLEDLYNLDSVEMQSLPIFTQAPAAGIYTSFSSFRNNKPDRPVEMDIQVDNRSRAQVSMVWYKKDKRKLEKVVETGWYAVSDGKQIAIYYNHRWWPLRKERSGFYFESPAVATGGNVMVVPAAGGAIGIGVAVPVAAGSGNWYRFRVNPGTGKAMHVMTNVN
jgi:hypothetical protein